MSDAIQNNDNGKSAGKAKSKKYKEPGKARRWIKDFFSELRKVTWPGFSKVLKQTGVVLAVTVCFLLVMIAFDSLLGVIYNGLLSGLSKETVVSFTSLFGGSSGGLL